MALLKTKRRGDGKRGRSVQDDHAPARLHLAKADPILRDLILRVGCCELTTRRNYFVTLCDSIISQQLSARVAEVIFDRFASLYPRRRPTPQALSSTPAARLREAGLSSQKAKYLKDLAAGFLDGRIRPSRLARQSNEEIIESLLSIYGIGRWTAEMFLIFSLNRLDVLPVDDLGIKKAVQRCYGLRSLPTAKKVRAIGKGWHPYETIASWYLWRSLRLPFPPDTASSILAVFRRCGASGSSDFAFYRSNTSRSRCRTSWKSPSEADPSFR